MPSSISLRRQLLLHLLVPLLGASVIGATLAYCIAYWMSGVVLDREISSAAIELRHEILEAPTEDHIRTFAMEADMLSPDRSGVLYSVIDRDGRTIAGTGDFPAPPEPDTSKGAGSKVGLYDAVVQGNPLRVASLRVIRDSGEGDHFQILVGKAKNERQGLAYEMLVATLPQELLLTAVVALAVLYGVRRGIRPLNDFAGVIASRSASNLDPLDVDAVPAEARYLVQSLNDLMQRVKAVADVQQRCAADAAHLMQTPLAGMKAQIELCQRQDISDETRRVLGHLHIGVERLSRMLRELLVLARNGPGARQNVQLVPTDLHQAVCDATADWVPIALEKDIDLGCTSCSPGVVIQGDGGQLRNLLDSLLDNAIRYTQPGGIVTIGFNPEEPTTLRVRDNGPGIPTAERGHVFDRFYRVLGNGAEGSGLGLAIVKEIAALHGATVDLGSGPCNVGTEVIVRFPKAAAQPYGEALYSA